VIEVADLKIKIISAETDNSLIIVRFKCSCGEGLASWPSNNIAPVAGKEYDVEIDTTAVLRVGENASFLTGSGACIIKVIDHRVQLTAEVDSVDEGGMVYLRLAPDCLFMAESFNSVIQPSSTVRTILDPRELQLWVVEL
jgi:4-diphosphocytidyl-2C-methyl-D-erythritol kinase